MLTSYDFDLLWILYACADTKESASSNNRYLRLSYKAKIVVCYVSVKATLQKSPVFLSF